MRKYSDGEMIAAIRRVAGNTRVLSGPRYERMRTKHEPARYTVMIRFGTWRNAVAAAGLQSPYVEGGIRRSCAQCGALYPGDFGKKSAKTCSTACARQLMAAAHFKGRDVTPQAARGRGAKIVVKRACAQCGDTAKRLETHHVDRDIFNNELGNLQVLCVPCHKRAHMTWDRNRSCPCCGRTFSSKRKKQQCCSLSCAVRWHRSQQHLRRDQLPAARVAE